MDIKDLLGSHQDTQHTQQAQERQHSTFEPAVTGSDPRHTLQPTPSFPLPSSSGGHPILPSPAPTISSVHSHPEYYHRRQSTPHLIKSENSAAAHAGWSYQAQQASPYPDYRGYDGNAYSLPPSSTYSPHKRASSFDEHSSKRQKKVKGANQKWDAEEDARIIELRGSGMKWGEISKKLPGRTEIACRLHFQNYLEKRGQWDEEKKTKLARVYERMKADLWQPLASELGVPWRSAEAMHWILGERDIAKRANTVPFALISQANGAGPQGEGNGRIAQANRMDAATIYFDPSDLVALQTPQSANPPVNTYSHQHVPTTNGISAEHPQREYEAGSNISPTSGNSAIARRETMQEPPRRDIPNDEGLRLPGLADLDNGISAYVGHGVRREGAGSHLTPREPQPPPHASSSPRSHRNSNVSEVSQSSQRLHTLADASLAKEKSLRRNSDGSNGSARSGGSGGSGGSGEDGYVQVRRQEIDDASTA